jgi:tRNA A58 N-methylase Trm61
MGKYTSAMVDSARCRDARRARLHRALDAVLGRDAGSGIVVYVSTYAELKRVVQELRDTGVILPEIGKSSDGRYGFRALTSRSNVDQALKRANVKALDAVLGNAR